MPKPKEADPADRKMGARVRYWRRRRDLTIRQLAEKICLDKSALSRIERGDQSIRPREIDALLAFFDVTIAQFYRPDVTAESDGGAKGRGVAA